MKKEFDYAGNEIKEGDEFVMIKILDIQTPSWIFTPQTREEIQIGKFSQQECFEIGTYHRVIVQEETMYELGYVWGISSKGGNPAATCYQTIALARIFDMDGRIIIAIKGISDTKEYYDTWKKKEKE